MKDNNKNIIINQKKQHHDTDNTKQKTSKMNSVNRNHEYLREEKITMKTINDN